MKKFMTIVLAAALVFAVAGQASAAALETSGEYRGRFWYLDNYKSDSSSEFWDQRLRLKLAWKVADGVTVNARADVLENVWQTVGADASEIDFDWANVAFAWGTANLTVGKQDVSWGPGVYAKADNRYRAKIGSKFGENSWSFAWDKLVETGKEFDEDWNGYSLGFVFPAAGWKFGVLGVYSDNKPVDSDILALDVTAEGMIGPAKLVFEGAYGAGDAGKNEQEGFETYIGGFFPTGAINWGVEFGYASGDDPKTVDNEGALFHDYNGPFNSFILFNNFDLDGYNSVYSGGADKGLNNAMALKASATFAFSKQLSLMGAGVWAQADQKIDGRDADMGVEVDALLKYVLNENVTVQTGLGYLFIGDYFGKDADDPLALTAHAVVTF